MERERGVDSKGDERRKKPSQSERVREGASLSEQKDAKKKE